MKLRVLRRHAQGRFAIDIDNVLSYQMPRLLFTVLFCIPLMLSGCAARSLSHSKVETVFDVEIGFTRIHDVPKIIGDANVYSTGDASTAAMHACYVVKMADRDYVLKFSSHLEMSHGVVSRIQYSESNAQNPATNCSFLQKNHAQVSSHLIHVISKVFVARNGIQFKTTPIDRTTVEWDICYPFVDLGKKKMWWARNADNEHVGCNTLSLHAENGIVSLFDLSHVEVVDWDEI